MSSLLASCNLNYFSSQLNDSAFTNLKGLIAGPVLAESAAGEIRETKERGPRASPAHFFHRPHWPIACNRLGRSWKWFFLNEIVSHRHENLSFSVVTCQTTIVQQNWYFLRSINTLFAWREVSLISLRLRFCFSCFSIWNFARVVARSIWSAPSHPGSFWAHERRGAKCDVYSSCNWA